MPRALRTLLFVLIAAAAITLTVSTLNWNPLHGNQLNLFLVSLCFVGETAFSVLAVRAVRRGALSEAAEWFSYQLSFIAAMLLFMFFYIISSPLLSGSQPG